MTNEIEERLKSSGFLDADIKLAQKLTRRGLDSHLHLINDIRHCERCPLSLNCHGQGDAPFVTTERVIGTGPWNSPLMVIGDMPGELEAKYGVPFIGEEGQLLTMILAKAGIDRNAVYMTYAVKCAGIREPDDKELTQCGRHIEKEIEAVNPQVILTVGEYAMKMANPKAATVENARGEVWGKKEKHKIIHTHSMKTLLQPNNGKYKSEIWHDISLAVTSVRKERPNYAYDRVGLSNL